MIGSDLQCTSLDFRLREWLNRNWNDRLMDLVRDGVYVINLDGTILRCNSTFRNSWETLHGDWHDSLFSSRMLPDDHTTVRTCHQLMMEGGMGGRTVRRFLAGDGSTEVFDVSESPIRSGDRLWGIIGVTRPVTVAAVRERGIGILPELHARDGGSSHPEVRAESLEERDRLEHAFRSSLGLIRGYAFALDRYPDLGEEKQHRFIGYIRGEADRLSRWLDQAFQAEDQTCKRLPVETVSLVEAIRAAAKHLNDYAIRRGITVIQDVPDTLPDILASRHALSSVLDAVLDSALSLTPPAGKITVTARHTDREIAVAVTDQGWDGAGLCSTDTVTWNPAPGDDLTEDSDVAAGLAGLDVAVARRLTEAIGGRMRIALVPGGGTTFNLTFPRMDSGACGKNLGLDLRKNQEASASRPAGLVAR